MKLKSLEIIGFKSFMERTLVTFDRDLTAVVGPNGCGKSNIVDAIRWVMGEQSARHLRGKQMEDVIFAGSEKRAPLSMASVELTFSTEGYQTPAAYLNHPEISICRRLYRSGESEYLINKMAVRLKDITDLFLGTGIGTKAYSIIEQDRVSQIILAKPEDRRFFIEEVAGISKFKSRKEAALRKMELTGQNLLRLSDLVGELERQLKSLDRQAKKAEKYRGIKKEFVKWDLLVSSHQYDEASTLQDKWEKDLREFDEKEAALQALANQSEIEIDSSRLQFEEKERSLTLLQNNLFELTNYLSLGEADCRHKKEESAALQTRLKTARRATDELKAEFMGAQNGLCQINEQKMLSDFEEAMFSEEVLKLEEQAGKYQTRIADLKATLEGAAEEIRLGEGSISDRSSKQALLTQKRDEILSRLASGGEEQEQLAKQINQIKRVHLETDAALISLKQLNLDLSAKTDGLSVELDQHRNNLAGEAIELQNLKEELTLRKSRLQSLEELQKNFEGYLEGTRAVLKNRMEIGEAGIIGTVADFVETEPQYESAVSAVLGERLHHVIVKSQQEGISAVDYLKTASGGRTSFIPMAVRTHSSGGGDIQEQEGVLGPLKNFVRFKTHENNIAEFLFGDVVLVGDLAKALDIWSGNGHRKTLVTLEGEVVDPAGVITGGSMANSSKALLEKKREMGELKNLIAKLEEDWGAKESIRKALEERVGILGKSLDMAKQNSVDEIIKITNQEKDLTHIRQELEALTTRQNALICRLSDDKGALKTLNAEIAQLAVELENLKTSRELKLRKLAEAKQAFSGMESGFEGIVQAQTVAKIEYAKAQQKGEHLEAELNRLMDGLHRVRMEMAHKEEEILNFGGRVEFLENEGTHLGKMLEKRMSQRGALDKNLTAQKEGYESQAGQIRQKEGALRELRLKAGEATRRLNEVTVCLTEVRGRLKHLSEQILERHQLDLSEIYRSHLDSTADLKTAQARVAELKDDLARLGEVNTGALEEYEEIKGRFEYLSRQKTDLEESLHTLERVIQKINRTTKEKFFETFKLVNEKFQSLFPQLFKGGQAKLLLTDENNILETGVEIVAQPPGKKLQSISLLSGGEKALTAVSLIFSIFQVKPSPFCVLDEVDAPLDDVNVGRYNEMIRSLTARTQYIVITHNKQTMEMADVLYGVTMQEPGISQMISVQLN